jgi:hypothetical protein
LQAKRRPENMPRNTKTPSTQTQTPETPAQVPAVQQSAVPAVAGPPNVFEAWAAAASRRRLNILKFNKGDWGLGKDFDEVPNGTEVVLLPHLTEWGIMTWEDGYPVDGSRISGRIIDGFVLPPKSQWPNRDPSTWERDEYTGKPKDPVVPFVEMPVVLIMAGEGVPALFSSMSGGGKDAVSALLAQYGARIRVSPNDAPKATLGSGSYPHKDRSVGRVKTPEFKVFGWVDRDPYVEAVEAEAA